MNPDEVAPSWIRLILGVRRHNNWTQSDLAQRLGVDRSTVARWEQGLREPHPAWLQLVRAFLPDSPTSVNSGEFSGNFQ